MGNNKNCITRIVEFSNEIVQIINCKMFKNIYVYLNKISRTFSFSIIIHHQCYTRKLFKWKSFGVVIGLKKKNCRVVIGLKKEL